MYFYTLTLVYIIIFRSASSLHVLKTHDMIGLDIRSDKRQSEKKDSDTDSAGVAVPSADTAPDNAGSTVDSADAAIVQSSRRKRASNQDFSNEPVSQEVTTSSDKIDGSSAAAYSDKKMKKVSTVEALPSDISTTTSEPHAAKPTTETVAPGK